MNWLVANPEDEASSSAISQLYFVLNFGNFLIPLFTVQFSDQIIFIIIEYCFINFQANLLRHQKPNIEDISGFGFE